MQCSSETIGTIAAALAKAQAQLVNPEKSLVGTIRSDQATRIRTVISLCPALQRAGYRAENSKPA